MEECHRSITAATGVPMYTQKARLPLCRVACDGVLRCSRMVPQMRVEEIRIDLRYLVGAATLVLHVRCRVLKYLCHSLLHPLLHLPRLYPVLDSLFLPQPRAVP
jgi:hypothetical protein